LGLEDFKKKTIFCFFKRFQTDRRLKQNKKAGSKFFDPAFVYPIFIEEQILTTGIIFIFKERKTL